MGEKKCPSCGEWSKWSNNIHETCQHCGGPLGGRDLEYHIQREKETKENHEKWIFFIKETDGFLIKSLKRTGNFFYTIFLAIITFLVWLIAIMPG